MLLMLSFVESCLIVILLVSRFFYAEQSGQQTQLFYLIFKGWDVQEYLNTRFVCHVWILKSRLEFIVLLCKIPSLNIVNFFIDLFIYVECQFVV